MILGSRMESDAVDSGVPWLGKVPTRWSQSRLWTLSRVRKERNPGGLGLLSVFLDRGVIPYSEGGGQVHAPSLDLSKYQVVHPGDFVLNNQQAWRGSVGVSAHHGIISPAYIVLALNSDLDRRFANYLLRSFRMVDQYVVASRGVGDIQRQVYWPRLRDILVPVPALDEQSAVVRFLDYADRRIRRFIRAKQKLIRLLEEQKRVMVNEVVTRGLDPSALMTPTGLPWAPTMPAHWALVPTKAHLRIRKVLVGNQHGRYRLLSLTKKGVIVRDISANKGKFSADLGTSQEVRQGDLVFCLFDVPETPRTVGLSDHDGMITGAYTVFACQEPAVARFIEAFYIAMDDRKLLSPLYSGLRNTIPKERLLGAKVPIPPPDERDAILDHIQSESAAYDAVGDRARREIDLLRELRTRLIADVVTGQLDVRAAAAALPDDPANLDPAEDAEDIPDEDLDEDDAPPEDDDE